LAYSNLGIALGAYLVAPGKMNLSCFSFSRRSRVSFLLEWLQPCSNPLLRADLAASGRPWSQIPWLRHFSGTACTFASRCCKQDYFLPLFVGDWATAMPGES